ncbi:MAG: hypothetical protein K2M91_11715 [Lachnospiraceae bacterium]|nr:hypothetical protein [Lachnospiraceae bacterium]
MERSIPIETDLGIINGRDGIFLDDVHSDDHNMTFTGDINGVKSANHNNAEKWIPYTLIFHQVLACFSCELDTYENIGDSSFCDSSDFDFIEESAWLQSLPIRKDYDKSRYKHYRLSTYDTIYNIIATDYELKIGRKESV